MLELDKCPKVNMTIGDESRSEEKLTFESTNPIMEFFEYEHLPLQVQFVSKMICEAAKQLDQNLKDCPEKSAGMRKLLEAKDCFVRAHIQNLTR